MAAALQITRFDPDGGIQAKSPATKIITPRAGVFRGRELTLRHRRLASGVAPLDKLIGGGIVRGRISEIIGATGAGKTSLAMAFAANATRNEAAAWIETGDQLDPASLIAAGVEPSRMLWVSCCQPNLLSRPRGVMTTETHDARVEAASGERRKWALASLKAAEWILAAGGFGLMVLDFGVVRFIPPSSALRLARAAESSGVALIVLAERRLCGTLAALSLELRRWRVCFSRTHRGASATFDGQVSEARVMRNKLGGSGGAARWSVVADAYLPQRS
jgi:hypothetical protein